MPNDDDRALVAHIREHYAPPPMTAVERSRFDARLRARIEARRRMRWGLGGLALAGAAAAALLFAAGPRPPTPTPAPEMAALPATPDSEALALDWLVEAPADDWLGGSTVLPADPLAVPALDDGVLAADETNDETNDEAADAVAEAEEALDGPAWMPDEYVLLAGLIEIEPYGAEGDWP